MSWRHSSISVNNLKPSDGLLGDLRKKITRFLQDLIPKLRGISGSFEMIEALGKRLLPLFLGEERVLLDNHIQAQALP